MWFLLTTACLKPPPPVMAASPLDVRVVSVVSSFDGAPAVAGGEELQDVLSAEVAAHGLTPSSPSQPAVLAADDTESRLMALGAGPLVLVETAPRYSSQMAGRYRWTVEVTLSLGGLGDASSRSFAVPVALVYDHQRELAAADAAAPAIARELRGALDDALAP